jgi:hypothetical protein
MVVMRVSSLAFVLFATACGPAHNASLCDQNPPPPQCSIACDPTPGSQNACPSGFFCNTSGTCDAQCTPGGNECGDNAMCTADGQCVPTNGSNPPGPDADCPAVNFTATTVTPSIELIIDRSGSMDTNDISPTRYKAIQAGINSVVSANQGKVIFGAAMFSGDQTPCLNLSGFTVPRALNNATAISSLLAAPSSQPSGNTPTADAIVQITADFAANPPPAGSPPIILLATDGEPNSCSDNTPNTGPSIAATKAAYSAGVRLFILGLAGLNTQFLQQMANAGQGVQNGQPDAPFFTANDPTSLDQALNSIIGGVLSCDLALSGQVDPATACTGGTVTLNGMTLTCGTDWKILPDGMTLELEGAACDTFKNSQGPTVTATFSCGSVIF